MKSFKSGKYDPAEHDGMSYAEFQGDVDYGDISPSNIMERDR